jgi:hypothetical protein
MDDWVIYHVIILHYDQFAIVSKIKIQFPYFDKIENCFTSDEISDNNFDFEITWCESDYFSN